MKIAIDITEAVNGWRLDILEEGKLPYRENIERFTDVMVYVSKYCLNRAGKIKPPINPMSVI